MCSRKAMKMDLDTSVAPCHMALLPTTIIIIIKFTTIISTRLTKEFCDWGNATEPHLHPLAPLLQFFGKFQTEAASNLSDTFNFDESQVSIQATYYEPGSRYVCHKDAKISSPDETAARKITAIYYPQNYRREGKGAN
eukprot:gb/GECG01010814.1/.p1 GENE.gb/GECG01010814.1/~~gb/GECG01010814.1/.p1  ORF type:complete len:138 (+),score=10.40 gb/GECG01010814.1/:1-414(+)